jgi:hypothetical protein
MDAEVGNAQMKLVLFARHPLRRRPSVPAEASCGVDGQHLYHDTSSFLLPYAAPTQDLTQNLVVLIREDLLTTLAAGHTLLLLLTGLRAGKLGLLLGGLDLVTKGIVLDLIGLLGLETRTASLTVRTKLALIPFPRRE